MVHSVFVSGGTGYLGVPLGTQLVGRGHGVRSIVRGRSGGKLAAGVDAVVADALRAETFVQDVAPADTFVHLTGVSHPAQWKGDQFRAIDLVSLKASVAAARRAGVNHFIYVSVAHPAPVMKAYIEVRTECEQIIRDSGLNATILRPWYVVGPGHRWAAALIPVYAIAENLPATRDGARRLGLVTCRAMVAALASAVEHPAAGVRVLGVPDIRNACPADGLSGRRPVVQG